MVRGKAGDRSTKIMRRKMENETEKKEGKEIKGSQARR